MTRDDREIELIGMRWQQVRDIAESVVPPIEKPKGGWDEAIPLILAAEYSEESKDIETAPAKSELAPNSVCYAVDFFEASGIPYCKQCGSPDHRDLSGKRLCPVNDSTCPWMV